MDVKVVLLVLGLLTLLEKPVEADYIWHYDEIPYEAKASCKRSTSYYSNSVTANNTDIDVGSDIDSLLDYSNKDICFYCVCSVDGKHAGCISRDPWFCEYYRVIRYPEAAKTRYHQLFHQERPAYFRQLSYRLRRTMDEGIVTYFNAVGDDVLNSTKCIPFVSEYSDCTEANYCSGCNRCQCNEEGEWSCEEVFMCPVNEDEAPSDQDTITSALDIMYNGMKNKEKRKPRPLVPAPPNPKDDLIVAGNNPYDEDFQSWFSRQKRSVNENSGHNNHENRTIKFFHTVDEINEDTLQNSNKSGTITAKKVQVNQIPKISRRTDVLDNFNKSTLSSLHIKYNQPQDYDHHIAENKIDAISHGHNKLDENELQKLMGNYSQSMKDKDLSKLVVNELKAGTEIIGGKNVIPTSNITFTPENDTLTAMAFIAGNLLSKLWNLEKDTSDDAIETEVLKHEKINNLLELFKEPLSIRQEIFLKNALEKLSDTLDKNKSIKNVSICETITDSDIFKSSYEFDDKDETRGAKFKKTKCDQPKTSKNVNENESQFDITVDVISKLNNVLSLIKKYENVQNNLINIKHQKSMSKEEFNPKDVLDIDENSSYELFGTLLDKITKMLIPNKNKSKTVTNKLKKLNQFGNRSSINKIFENKYNINLDKLNMTTKDRIILDYLNHIESNPHCLFQNDIRKKIDYIDLNIEGNILYNLSEFLKVKSFVDLIKLTQLKHPTEKPINDTYTTTDVPTTVSPLKKLLRNGAIVETNQLNNTKEKLKSHLKAIIDDLLQLQKEIGVDDAKIVNALPCIYNILNADKNLNEQKYQRLNVTQITPLNKMKSLLDELKLELTAGMPSRRNNLIVQETPKSAIVWERMIKNINSLQKKTRRKFDSEKPKTYEQLKNIMEQVDVTGNTYKNFAMFSGTPPHKRLMLLKTLEADVKQQSNALTNIINSMDTIDKLPMDKHNEIKEFIDNVGNNLRLSTKVLEGLDKPKQKINSQVEVLSNKALDKTPLQSPKSMNLLKEMVDYKSNNIKLSRDQILNQLMTNRVRFYLRLKEANGSDLNNDINYNIGKRILFFIQSGNLNVARELYKIFIDNKQKEERLFQMRESTTANYSRKRAPFFKALENK